MNINLKRLVEVNGASVLEDNFIKIKGEDNSKGVVFSDDDQVFVEISLSDCDMIYLCIGDNRLLLQKNSENTFFWSPQMSRNGVRYCSIFYNVFGLINPIIEAHNGDSVRLVQLEDIEVLSNKRKSALVAMMYFFINSEQNYKLIKSAINKKDSKSLLKADSINAIDSLFTLSQKVESDLRIIAKKPIKTLVRKSHIDGSSISPDSEETVSWVMQNFGTAFAANGDYADFFYDGIGYKMDSVLSSDIIETTNAYENKVIHSFLSKIRRILLSFIFDLKDDAAICIDDSEKMSFSGIISYQRAVIAKRSIHKIELIDTVIRKCMLIANRAIPVSSDHVRSIRLTQKAKKNRAYLALFNEYRKINDTLHKIHASSLGGVGVDGVPALFELYVLSCLIKAIGCFAILQEFGDGKYVFSCGNKKIVLSYEREVFKPGMNQEGDYVNTDLEHFGQSINNHHGRGWGNKFDKRSPDFIIEVIDGNNTDVFILDAKHKDPVTAYESDLPKCTMRYFHGIQAVGGESVVKGVFIVSPRSKDIIDKEYLDYHSSPYDFFGKKRVLPALGLIMIDINESGYSNSINQVIEKIIV